MTDDTPCSRNVNRNVRKKTYGHVTNKLEVLRFKEHKNMYFLLFKAVIRTDRSSFIRFSSHINSHSFFLPERA